MFFRLPTVSRCFGLIVYTVVVAAAVDTTYPQNSSDDDLFLRGGIPQHSQHRNGADDGTFIKQHHRYHQDRLLSGKEGDLQLLFTEYSLLSSPTTDDGGYESRRRAAEGEETDFFEVSISLSPEKADDNVEPDGCSEADQVLVGHELNLLLLGFGIGGDSGAGSFNPAFLAGVCPIPFDLPVPENGPPDMVMPYGYRWVGVGYCRSCGKDNSDKRRSLVEDSSTTSITAPTTTKPPVNGDDNNDVSSSIASMLKNAIDTTIVPKYASCVGPNPNFFVEVKGVKPSDIDVMCTSEKPPVLDTIGYDDWKPNAYTSNGSSCGSCVKLDFETKANGKNFKNGSMLKKREYWESIYGVKVFVSPGNATRTREKGRIYRPPVTDEFGNVLIIPDAEASYHAANMSGGTITFKFVEPVLISDVGIIDFDGKTAPEIKAFIKGSKNIEINGPFLPAGEAKRVIMSKTNVHKFEVRLAGAGGITELNYCPIC